MRNPNRLYEEVEVEEVYASEDEAALADFENAVAEANAEGMDEALADFEFAAPVTRAVR